MRYAIVMEGAGSSDSAYEPDLPGCVATGATVEEVEAQIREVKQLPFTWKGSAKTARLCPPPASRVEYVDIAARLGSAADARRARLTFTSRGFAARSSTLWQRRREDMESANTQGRIWGTRARDWADVQEGVARPLYEEILRKTGIRAGGSVLDVGCGSGTFCEMAAGLGATVSGIDAAEALIAIARERVPDGDFRVGEMEALPYRDRAFDVVTGFSSFQFAANPASALREASRVSRTGTVVMNWSPKNGRHEVWYFDFVEVVDESRTRPEVHRRVS